MNSEKGSNLNDFVQRVEKGSFSVDQFLHDPFDRVIAWLVDIFVTLFCKGTEPKRI